MSEDYRGVVDGSVGFLGASYCDALVLEYSLHSSHRYSINACINTFDGWVCGGTLVLSSKPVITGCEKASTLVETGSGYWYASLLECKGPLSVFSSRYERVCSLLIEAGEFEVLGAASRVDGAGLRVSASITTRQAYGVVCNGGCSSGGSGLISGVYDVVLREAVGGRVCLDLTRLFSIALGLDDTISRGVAWCLLVEDTPILETVPVKVVLDATGRQCFHTGLVLYGSRGYYHAVKHASSLYDFVEGYLVLRASNSVEGIVPLLAKIVSLNGGSSRGSCYSMPPVCSVRFSGGSLCFASPRILDGVYSCSIVQRDSILVFEDCIGIAELLDRLKSEARVYCVEKSTGLECSYETSLAQLTTLLLFYGSIIGRKLFELVEDIGSYHSNIWQLLD